MFFCQLGILSPQRLSLIGKKVNISKEVIRDSLELLLDAGEEKGQSITQVSSCIRCIICPNKTKGSSRSSLQLTRLLVTGIRFFRKRYWLYPLSVIVFTNGYIWL